MKAEISVIIPVYNSEDSLEELYVRLKKVLTGYSQGFEIILVDDFSRDNSYQLMTALRERDEQVKTIRLSSNYGQNNATFCGLVYSQGKYVVTLDDDLQHPPEEIPLLVNQIKAGYDAVFGVPVIKQHARYRNWGSMLVNYCLTMVTPKPLKLRVSSFRALSRRTVDAVCSEHRNRTFIYLAVPILRNSPRAISVSVKHDSRKHGKSNYNLKKTAGLVMKLLVYYSFVPMKILMVLWLFLGGLWIKNIHFAILSIFMGLLTFLSIILGAVYWQKYHSKPPYLISEIKL